MPTALLIIALAVVLGVVATGWHRSHNMPEPLGSAWAEQSFAQRQVGEYDASTDPLLGLLENALHVACYGELAATVSDEGLHKQAATLLRQVREQAPAIMRIAAVRAERKGSCLYLGMEGPVAIADLSERGWKVQPLYERI